MASNRAQMEKKVTELMQKTKLSRPVVHNLVEQFHALHRRHKGLEREKVQDTLMDKFNILDINILDRIYRTFNAPTNNSTNLKPDDYVVGMGSFLSDDLDEKIKFCFRVYDLNADGYITKEEMFNFLKNSMVTKSHDHVDEDGDESIKELTEIVIKLLDTDRDGRVSQADFQAGVHENKLLLEILGPCLPDEKSRRAYLRLMGDPDMSLQPTTITARNQAKKGKGRRSHSQQRKC